MIKVGTDILKIKKVKNMIDSNSKGFISLFSENELSLANNCGDKVNFLASRFACKEAIFKCLDIKMDIKYLKEIETLKNENGRPVVNLNGNIKKICENLKIKDIDISISYEDEYVVVFALINMN